MSQRSPIRDTSVRPCNADFSMGNVQHIRRMSLRVSWTCVRTGAVHDWWLGWQCDCAQFPHAEQLLMSSKTSEERYSASVVLAKNRATLYADLNLMQKSSSQTLHGMLSLNRGLPWSSVISLIQMQHVALRLGSRPYLDQYTWEKILCKTDWITCLRLNHISIAKELLPSTKETQEHLNVATANGNISLVSRMLKTISGFPDLDIAAEADQLEMLTYLDGLDKAGSSICMASPKMAIYAAANCNQGMLEWLMTNRLEIDGKGILEAAAGTGSMPLVHWVLEQVDQCRMTYIDQHQSRIATRRALQDGHVGIANVLIDRFSHHSGACNAACEVANLVVIQQILPAYCKYLTSNNLAQVLRLALERGDEHIFSYVLEFLSVLQSRRFLVNPRHPLLDIAAEYGTLSMCELLHARLPDDLKNSSVTDQAMAAAAAGRNNSELVDTLVTAFDEFLHIAGFWAWNKWLLIAYMTSNL